MEKVAIISELQADSLRGQLYEPVSYFYPIKDCDGNWIISQQEIDNCVNPDFLWIKQLSLINWCGPYVPVSGGTENYFTQFLSGNTNN
jgi:hypothetical protein